MKRIRRFLVALLVFCTVFTCFSPLGAQAAQVKLSKKNITLTAGKSKTLKLTKGKKKLSNVKWKSKNNKIVKVTQKGKITGVKAGTAKVVATYKKKTYTCKVTVNAKKQTNKVTPTPTPEPTPEVTPTPKADEKEPTITEQPISEVVNWTTHDEEFEWKVCAQGEDAGAEVDTTLLTRKYVSFDPWPTNVNQIDYVIKNCKDPYVIAALYVVALDNFVYRGMGDYTSPAFAMWNSLMDGAGLKKDKYDFSLSNFDKQNILASGFAQKMGDVEPAYTYAARAYLFGATPENQYTPCIYGTNTPCLEDKTEWAIAIDQYPYTGNFDEHYENAYINNVALNNPTLNNQRVAYLNDGTVYTFNIDQGDPLKGKYITLCPHRYSLSQGTEVGPKEVVTHFGGNYMIGLAWNTGNSRWVTVKNRNNLINGTDPSTFTWSGGCNPYSLGMISNNYVAPKVDDGF